VRPEVPIHVRGREVRRSDRAEVLGMLEDSAREPRAELPAALPAPPEASETGPEVLGEPLGIREAAALIGCSAWTVRQQCLRQGLPHFRASRTGRLIFYRTQVVRWLIEKQKERRW
jgi:hypothetical protein